MADRRQDEIARELIDLLRGQGRIRQTAKGAEFQDASGRWIALDNSSVEITEQVVRTRRVRKKEERQPLWAALIYQCVQDGVYWGILPRLKYEYWLWTDISLTKIFEIYPFVGEQADLPGTFNTFNGSLTELGPPLGPGELITSWMSLDEAKGVHLSFRWYENFSNVQPLEDSIISERWARETWRHFYWKNGRIKEVPQSKAWNRRVINSPFRFVGSSVSPTLIALQSELEQPGIDAIGAPIVPLTTTPPPQPCVRYWQVEGDFLADGSVNGSGIPIPEHFREPSAPSNDFRSSAIGNEVQIYEKRRQIYRFRGLSHVDGVSPGPITTNRWNEPFVFNFYKGPLPNPPNTTPETMQSCSSAGIVDNGSSLNFVVTGSYKIPGFNPDRIGYEEGVWVGGLPSTAWRPKSFAVF